MTCAGLDLQLVVILLAWLGFGLLRSSCIVSLPVSRHSSMEAIARSALPQHPPRSGLCKLGFVHVLFYAAACAAMEFTSPQGLSKPWEYADAEKQEEHDMCRP